MVEQEFPGVRPRELNRDRPDNTTAFVGDDGKIIVQSEDGALGTREFPGEDQDWGVKGQDINSEEVIASPSEIGAAGELSGIVESDDELEFSVVIDWQDDNRNTLVTERPPNLQNIGEDQDYSVTIESVKTKKSTAEVRVINESEEIEHKVTAVLNFH